MLKKKQMKNQDVLTHADWYASSNIDWAHFIFERLNALNKCHLLHCIVSLVWLANGFARNWDLISIQLFLRLLDAHTHACLFSPINCEWYLFFLRLWLWQCIGHWQQLQETASTDSWISLLLHSMCYRTLRIAQEQTVISSQDGGNSACNGTFQAGWLSPTFPSTCLFFCTLLKLFLNIGLAVCFHYLFSNRSSRINLIYYWQ